jgi:metacaspase-1
MSSNEASLYKQNRINEARRVFNENVARLNSALINNMKIVNQSRLRNKQSIVNSLITKYNSDLAILRRNLNLQINNINSMTLEFNVVKPNNKKAFLIGINYVGTPYQLNGCIDDTERMTDLLTQRGFDKFKILTDYTTIKPTKENILNGFKDMIENAEANDILFFYFSGHGSYTLDRNGDETDGKDEMLISSDLQGILDDELKTILSNSMKRDVTIVGLFDSCHSGTMFDLKYNYLDSNNYDKYTENEKVSECNGNVLMISGCMDSQTSSEATINNKPQGAMTWSFIECLNKTPNASWRELLKSMRDLLKTSRFTQIPQMSTDSFYDIDSKLFI